MCAHLTDANGRTVEIGDIFEGDFVLLDADGQEITRGTVAGPHAFERQDDGLLILQGIDLVPTFTAKEVTASIRRPVEPNNRWPSLSDVVKPAPYEDAFRMPLYLAYAAQNVPPAVPYGWPDPGRGGARKRRRGRR